jgi:hypothetical protein
VRGVAGHREHHRGLTAEQHRGEVERTAAEHDVGRRLVALGRFDLVDADVAVLRVDPPASVELVALEYPRPVDRLIGVGPAAEPGE